MNKKYNLKIYIYIMPYVIRKNNNKNTYSVKNKATGVVHSKGTSKKRAEAQVKLLNAIDHGFKLRR